MGTFWIGYGNEVRLGDRNKKLVACDRLLKHVMHLAARLQHGDTQICKLPADCLV